MNKFTVIKAVLKQPSLVYILCIIPFLISCTGVEQKTKSNRLQFATSPYLQQHADNPVDWFEWGDEALKLALKQNKPLLISIGYASCHWCHEMEKENFMDTAIARVMNENFICIKVDREERPDIDNIYMDALQLLSGEAGWPLNAFALPDGKPFFAGTYYNKKSWMSLLLNISNSYKNKHTLVVTQANALLNGIADDELLFIDTARAESKFSLSAYQNLYDSIYSHADTVNGGLIGMEKFPTPAYPEFLLQHYYLTGEQDALDAANLTLQKMAMGGIYDHAGGGFARYTTDAEWKIPHFEKMLYDNAQLISVYAHAFQLTKNEFYKNVFTETISFIENALAAPGGGYYSSLNAVTDDGEGKFYAWSEKEFFDVVGNDQLLATYFNVSTKGNWKQGYNILNAGKMPGDFAKDNNIGPAFFETQLKEAKNALLKTRSKRNAPSVDTKIITSWNCILLKSYADAYAATSSEIFLLKAKSLASFIESNLIGKNGKMIRSVNDSENKIDGFIDDYAWAALAFQRLYEVSFDKHYINVSKQVIDYTIDNFWNERTGLFYYTEDSSVLVLRKTEVADNAIPSSNAILAKVLSINGLLFNDTSYTNKSLQMLNAVKERLKKMPRYHIQWCNFAGFQTARTYEVVIAGKDAVKVNMQLQKNYLPNCTILGSVDDEVLPLIKGKIVDNKTLIYVCSEKVCKRPEENVETALKHILL